MEVEKSIGRGSFGEVLKATLGSKEVALKRIYYAEYRDMLPILMTDIELGCTVRIFRFAPTPAHLMQTPP